MKFNLTNFVKNAYGIDLDEVGDYNNFYFDWVDGSKIYGFSSYVKEFKNKYPKYKDYEYEDFERAANMRHEYSYIDEYLDEYYSRLESKLRKDIYNVSKFYIGDVDEVATKGTIEVDVFDVVNDVISFKGTNVIDDFAAIIINCINGYGMFHYDDVEDFFDTQPASTTQEKIEAIESHTHWLKHFESIYGTIYDAFKFDSNDIDRYGTMGDYDFTEEDMENI